MYWIINVGYECDVQVWNRQWKILTGQSRDEVSFLPFSQYGSVLWFATKSELITHRWFCYCWVVLALHQGLLLSAVAEVLLAVGKQWMNSLFCFANTQFCFIYKLSLPQLMSFIPFLLMSLSHPARQGGVEEWASSWWVPGCWLGSLHHTYRH